MSVLYEHTSLVPSHTPGLLRAVFPLVDILDPDPLHALRPPGIPSAMLGTPLRDSVPCAASTPKPTTFAYFADAVASSCWMGCVTNCLMTKFVLPDAPLSNGT